MLHQTILIAVGLMLPLTAQAQRRGEGPRSPEPRVERPLSDRSQRGTQQPRSRPLAPRSAPERLRSRSPQRSQGQRSQRLRVQGQRRQGVGQRGRPLRRAPLRRAPIQRGVPLQRHRGFRGRRAPIRPQPIWVPGYYDQIHHPARYRWTIRCGRPVRVCVQAAWIERVWVPGDYRY